LIIPRISGSWSTSWRSWIANVERCLPAAAGRGRSRRHDGGEPLLPGPVCTHILETPYLIGGRVRAGGSRERPLTLTQPTSIHFVSDQCNGIRPSRIVGRFREPPARQRFRNTAVVCTITSGYGQRSKAAPFQGARPGRAKAALHGSDRVGPPKSNRNGLVKLPTVNRVRTPLLPW